MISVSDLREQLKGSLGRVPSERLDELVDAIFDVKRKVHVSTTCRHCRKDTMQWIEVGDPVATAKAVAVLLDQGLGKPVESRQVDVNVLVGRARAELEALSDAELVELAGVEEAEWKELSP